ncbi:MAG: methyltransferase domain-containing protein, partial [Patescibacteria group bacterium]|nr:methyltransferase domain-containing protein [Patescibacteria group bacterium]
MVPSKKIKYQYSGKFDPYKLKIDNIDRLSTAFMPKNAKVLELGCATGFMSRYFKTKLHCQVVGVDINPATKPDIVGDIQQQNTWHKIKLQAPYDIVFASA